jgi:hypothetical protein
MNKSASPLRRLGTWLAIGLLLLAAGSPYITAALTATANDPTTTVTRRADIEIGVFLAFIGLSVLAVGMLLYTWRAFRQPRAIVN